MGIITIKGLRMQGYHGVMAQERKVGNTFEVNLSLDVPGADEAMLTDDLNQTINYAEVVEIVKAEMAKPCKLIEAVAGNICKAIIHRFPGRIQGGEITVAKLAPPIPAELDSVAYTWKF